MDGSEGGGGWTARLLSRSDLQELFKLGSTSSSDTMTKLEELSLPPPASLSATIDAHLDSLPTALGGAQLCCGISRHDDLLQLSSVEGGFRARKAARSVPSTAALPATLPVLVDMTTDDRFEGDAEAGDAAPTLMPRPLVRGPSVRPATTVSSAHPPSLVVVDDSDASGDEGEYRMQRTVPQDDVHLANTTQTASPLLGFSCRAGTIAAPLQPSFDSPSSFSFPDVPDIASSFPSASSASPAMDGSPGAADYSALPRVSRALNEADVDFHHPGSILRNAVLRAQSVIMLRDEGEARVLLCEILDLLEGLKHQHLSASDDEGNCYALHVAAMELAALLGWLPASPPNQREHCDSTGPVADVAHGEIAGGGEPLLAGEYAAQM